MRAFLRKEVGCAEQRGGQAMIEPVRPIALADIEEARERIAGTVLRTPLVRLDLGEAAPTSG